MKIQHKYIVSRKLFPDCLRQEDHVELHMFFLFSFETISAVCGQNFVSLFSTHRFILQECQAVTDFGFRKKPSCRALKKLYGSHDIRGYAC